MTVGLAKDRKRLALAAEFGARHTLVTDEVDVAEAVRGITSGKMASVVVECTATAPGMNREIPLLQQTITSSVTMRINIWQEE